MNWCKYFSDIELDPTAITPQITIGQYLEAKNHLNECKSCSDSVERVLRNAPEDKLFISEN